MPAKRRPRLTFRPATVDRWHDLEALFGPRGACAGCWCMWWRLPRAAFDKGKGAGNRRALKKLLDSGTVPGILAYSGDEPIGWCAVAPREDYSRLARSRSLAPVDDRPVWSITCFFVRRDWRGKGVTTALLDAAARHARAHGGRIVEGYPVVPKEGRIPDAFAYTGLLSAFRAARFEEVARRSSFRAIVRRAVGRAVVGLAAVALFAATPSRADDPADFKRYVETIRAKGMSEAAEDSLRVVAGIRTGQTLLVLVKELGTGRYATTYEAAACPRAATDEQARRNAEARQAALEKETRALRPFADADGSGFVSGDEGGRFRRVVESGYKAAQVIDEEGPNAALVGQALTMDAAEMRRWLSEYRALSARLAKAGLTPLPPVRLGAGAPDGS